MATTTLYVFCYLPGRVEAVPAGRLEHDDRNGVGLFRYGHRYRERPDAVSVDCVALPLGGDFSAVTVNGGLYGAFRDASPDYWGRLVIASRLGCPIEALTEVDYLTHANATRVGNLDFRRSLEDPEPPLAPPQFVDLGDLLNASRDLEQGNVTDERIQILLEQGSSLGGARPKCTVELDGQLWLAKFPSRGDTVNMPRLEYATLALAKTCELHVTETRLVTTGGRDVFLVRRFDRTATAGGWARRGFMSALSLAERDERDRDRWSYRTVADRIRKYSVHADADLRELFRRISFNILVRNTDDHPRNHGFLAEGDGVTLSPLFDVLPALTRRGVGSEFYLSMSMGEKGRLARFDNLCSAAGSFNLSRREAGDLTAAMQTYIESSWRSVFTSVGVTDVELEKIALSFP
jgi:serine/threonine-protein kinase HipA